MELSKVTFEEDIVDVQNYWNNMEQKLVNVTDMVAPIVEFTGNQASTNIRIYNWTHLKYYAK